MSLKTRKNFKKRFVNKKNTDAINATQPKCLMKTCRAKKYQSIFGSVGGSTRTTRNLFY
jgi:hypothetical protein